MSFCERLVSGPKTAKVIFPLSHEANQLLAKYHYAGPGSQLVDTIKAMIASSTIVWENELSGVVLRCNEEIAAKIVHRNRSYTEYSSLQ
jgi:hypothetical protein